MFFSKSIALSLVSALGLVSSVAASPIESRGSGWYPATYDSSGEATCKNGEVLASGALVGVDVPICVIDSSILSGNDVHVLKRNGGGHWYQANVVNGKATCANGDILGSGAIVGVDVPICIIGSSILSGNDVHVLKRGGGGGSWYQANVVNGQATCANGDVAFSGALVGVDVPICVIGSSILSGNDVHVLKRNGGGSWYQANVVNGKATCANGNILGSGAIVGVDVPICIIGSSILSNNDVNVL